MASRRAYTAMLFLCPFFFFEIQGIAQAQTSKPVPKLFSRVVDLAEMINSDTEVQLVSQLKAHEEKTGNQIAILTIPSLSGEALEQYSLRVAREWALGQKDQDNGVLFLIAKNDRKMRIEVGYGLESHLTDAISSFIIRNTVRPLFRKSRFSQGISVGTGQIIEVLEADGAQLQKWKKRSSGKDTDWPLFLFLALWFMIFFGGAFSSILIRLFGREIKPGHYRWLGMDAGPNAPKPLRKGYGNHRGGHWSGGGGFGGSGGGFSGGGGGFGGGGSSGGW